YVQGGRAHEADELIHLGVVPRVAVAMDERVTVDESPPRRLAADRLFFQVIDQVGKDFLAGPYATGVARIRVVGQLDVSIQIGQAADGGDLAVRPAQAKLQVEAVDALALDRQVPLAVA